MALYVMSDTHLSLLVDKPMDVFGKRWDGYVEKIKSNWLQTVKDGDTVVINGDISWGMSLCDTEEDFRFLENLPGKKLLCRGNHDYWWDTVAKNKKFLEKCGFSSFDFIQNNSFCVDGIVIGGSRGWFYDKKVSPTDSDYMKIVSREVIRIELSILDAIKKYEKTPYIFLHFPPVYKDCICAEILEILKKYSIKKCYYGHIHNVYDLPPSFIYEGIEFICTSADYLDFRPLLVE